MKALPDCTAPEPRILFVGINPGLRSGEIGHHFAGPGNPFWRLLHAAGLTPVLLRPEEDARLPEFGLGLTNLVHRPTRAASELRKDEIAAGRVELRHTIEHLRPRVVAFCGLTLYADFFALKKSGGAGEKPERIPEATASSPGGARVFVLPNPSGLNASFPGFQHKLVWFEKLRDFANR